jgi:hypothetical protein
MVACDLARALLFLTMAISGLPLLVVVGLLILAVFVGPAFSAAEVTYLSSVMDASSFRAANGLRMVTNQLAQAAGFAAGGLLVSFISPHGALVADAASYAISAAMIGFTLKRDEPRQSTIAGSDIPKASREPTTPQAWRDRRLAALVALSCLAGFFIVPEALAVPFGNRAGASTTETGALIASVPLGGAIGAVLFVRLVAPEFRARIANWMAIGCGLPLVVTAFGSSWSIALGCWLVSGALAAYQVEVLSAIVYAIPPAVRARFVGLAGSALLGVQGLGVVVFAGVARLTTPAHAIGLAGLAGSLGAIALTLGPLRMGPTRRKARPSAEPPHAPRLSDAPRPAQSKRSVSYVPRHKSKRPLKVSRR